LDFGAWISYAPKYEKGSLLLTSNRPIEAWGEMLGDEIVTTTVLDHLLRHSYVLTIKGDSYRLREKRRTGMLPVSAPPPAMRDHDLAKQDAIYMFFNILPLVSG
jgi:hypothetical protein